jgi:hypothetical protein
MTKNEEPQHQRDIDEPPLLEGIDYYIENDLFVFTAAYLQRRGYCCESGCRHCPYGFQDSAQKKREAIADLPPSK